MMAVVGVVLGLILGAVILSAAVIAWAAYFDINLDPDSHKH